MRISTYTVKPRIPDSLKPLEEIAHNLWISWNFDSIMLFIRLDYDAWLASQQNPAKMLGMVSQERYEELAKDDSYLNALNEVYEKFKRYKEGETWYKSNKSKAIGAKDVVAYFSMEYGMDVSLPIYSGGLGILSGDHMKTSSDLGLPLVGVGLLYRQGYFKQYLNADGFQQESYPENDWYNMPVHECRDPSGAEIKISVDMAGQMVLAKVWEVKVGRSSLYLLDTNIDENRPELKGITATLYGGDKEMRIRQEILLGIGGIRALRALGINPAVTHMNEGHSAFLGLERIREHMVERGFSFDEAMQALWPTNIFTTHTPVPAGNERFANELMEKYFRYIAQELRIDWDSFMALGRVNPGDKQEHFCMTVLALRCSAYCNGVARLHGVVSRAMWKELWPGLSEHEVPIESITNGVHPRTWISNNMLELLDRYFGPRFYDEPMNAEIWSRMARISDEELWRTHERRRERLVVFARDRVRAQMRRNGVAETQLHRADDVLSPYALTISFARRFATYKRGTLLFRDPERLLKLLQDSERPIQLIFAGKAHPHDLPGKQLIKEIFHFSSLPEVRSRIVFLEDYDMTMARYMTSGSDLWLNTPRRPLEASGTSGMKAAMNGVLNCSVLDGWWDEAYSAEVGWAIGRGEEYKDEELQDEIESKALYDLLEREIIPTFYSRGRDGLPREWIKRMKASISTIGCEMSSHRMLIEYSDRFYFPALERYARLAKDGFAQSKELAAYLGKLRSAWNGLQILEVASDASPIMERGAFITVRAKLDLGALKPDEVEVELYHGGISSQGEFHKPERSRMEPIKGGSGGVCEFEVRIECRSTGRQGHAVRVLPRHEGLVHPFIPGLVKWA
jgi:starch phosphorylase